MIAFIRFKTILFDRSYTIRQIEHASGVIVASAMNEKKEAKRTTKSFHFHSHALWSRVFPFSLFFFLFFHETRTRFIYSYRLREKRKNGGERAGGDARTIVFIHSRAKDATVARRANVSRIPSGIDRIATSSAILRAGGHSLKLRLHQATLARLQRLSLSRSWRSKFFTFFYVINLLYPVTRQSVQRIFTILTCITIAIDLPRWM